MPKNVKSIPIDGQIIVTRPDNTTDIFHPKTTTEYVVLSDSDKSSTNLPENTDTVSELIGKFGKLAFKDEVNLDSIEFNNASQTEDGLMSKEDKTKLDNIPSTGFFVDSELSEDSENPVQNKVINTALAGKLSTSGTAAKATADANGNNIASTYATKSQITALDSTSSGTGAVVTAVSQTDGKVSVTKGNVKIPVGSESATTYATIWVE